MAEFRYYLNRQGVRGPQGPQGEKGFSPDISVEKDTLSEYVLRITNEGGYFLTANLREHKEDRGGTYIRYDRDTGVMYVGDAELATTDTLGVIRIAGDDDFAGKAEDAAVTPAQVQDYVTGEIDTVNQKIDTLDKTTVKLDGTQTITGNKAFNGETTFNAHTWTSEQEAVNLNVTSLATMKNVNVSGTLTSNGEINAVAIKAAGIKNNQNNKYYLTQSSITAGDNVIIEETTDGVKISSIGGGGGASINDSTISSTNTWSSSKINSELNKKANLSDLSGYVTVNKYNELLARVVALETEINGGIA